MSNNTLGEKLREKRTMKGIKLTDFAAMLGVSKQTASNWECSNMRPTIDMLKRICEMLSCSSDFLLGLEKDDTPTINVSELTPNQILHINQLINDFAELNKQTKTRE